MNYKQKNEHFNKIKIKNKCHSLCLSNNTCHYLCSSINYKNIMILFLMFVLIFQIISINIIQI
jgi:hypothetical protein